MTTLPTTRDHCLHAIDLAIRVCRRLHLAAIRAGDTDEADHYRRRVDALLDQRTETADA
jgi:hypothetical protein